MRAVRGLPLLASLVLLAVLIGGGVQAQISRAASAGRATAGSPLSGTITTRRSVQGPATTAVCPAGQRALYVNNHCSYDVWFAEQPASAPGGTPQCPDPTNAMTDNFGCPTGTTCNSGGVCVTSCTDPGTVDASDCGPNQTCFDGGFTQEKTGNKIYECFANYFEPTPVSTPTPVSGSGWDLAANGGESLICVPEASAASGSAPGAGCTLNSNCQSYECMSNNTDGSIPNLIGDFCLPNETGCTCANTITWSGNFWGRTGCTVTNSGLTCQTGDCEGQVNCTTGPPPPSTLTEMTLLTPSDPDNEDSYDISMVSGFNVGYSMQPVAGTYSGDCTSPGVGCSYDIDSQCPAELQFLSADQQTVLGCYTPYEACNASSPSALLNCATTVPFQCNAAADCPFGQQATAAQTMACTSGQCVCTQNSDCPQGYGCSGGGCTPTGNTSGTWTDIYGCKNFYDISPLNGNIFPSWLTGTAEETGITCGCPSWSGTNCLAHNYNWETAPIGGGNSNTAESYFKIFHDACPTAYSYAYDDAVGNGGCFPTSAQATVGASYQIDFCPAQASTATPTPTATATATPSASATSTASPTATASPTMTPSPTETASPTATTTASASATPTASSTVTATATASATPTSSITATATATTTATPTPTLTPTPSATATPHCAFNFYLTTNPAGTLAFGDVFPGTPVTLPLAVTNNAPSGTLSLSTKIQNGPDFEVTSGSCKASKSVKAGATCNYNIRLKARKRDEGKALSAQMTITGKFSKNVCPAGQKQTVSLTLAASVDQIAARPKDSQ